MGRVYSEVKVNGRALWTLFDTGARHTYIARAATSGFHVARLPKPLQAGLGGKNQAFDSTAFLHDAFIEGKPVQFTARVIDEIGPDEQGQAIEILFGAFDMRNWGIVPVPHDERLDMTHYPTEFIEY